MSKAKFLFIVFLAIVVVFSLSFISKTSVVKAVAGFDDSEEENEELNTARNTERISSESDDDEDDDEDEDEDTSDSEDFDDLASKSKGQVNAELHRSVVANFVQSLLKVASRSEGGIGEQVRVVAREQNMTREKIAEALKRVENRNRIKRFLIGSDYKNLGELRSEMVQTGNRLEQLNRLREKLASESDLELEEQIQALEQERIRIENFIKSQEGKFSLFGWLIKLFKKQ